MRRLGRRTTRDAGGSRERLRGRSVLCGLVIGVLSLPPGPDAAGAAELLGVSLGEGVETTLITDPLTSATYAFGSEPHFMSSDGERVFVARGCGETCHPPGATDVYYRGSGAEQSLEPPHTTERTFAEAVSPNGEFYSLVSHLTFSSMPPCAVYRTSDASLVWEPTVPVLTTGDQIQRCYPRGISNDGLSLSFSVIVSDQMSGVSEQLFFQRQSQAEARNLTGDGYLFSGFDSMSDDGSTILFHDSCECGDNQLPSISRVFDSVARTTSELPSGNGVDSLIAYDRMSGDGTRLLRTTIDTNGARVEVIDLVSGSNLATLPPEFTYRLVGVSRNLTHWMRYEGTSLECPSSFQLYDLTTGQSRTLLSASDCSLNTHFGLRAFFLVSDDGATVVWNNVLDVFPGDSNERADAVILSLAQTPECSDSLDNDKDGLVDLADRGCSDADDDNESDEPSLDVITLIADPSSLVRQETTTLYATLTTSTGEPITGELVSFRVQSGPNLGRLGAVISTDPSGVASTTLRGRTTGQDVIVAWVDETINGVVDPHEPYSLTTVAWLKSVEPDRYETYRWQRLSEFSSAIHLMDISMAKFVIEADSPWHDSRLNWSTDFCSGLAPLFIEWVNEFLNACRRHDFGYRNFGMKDSSSRALDPTEERRSLIDDRFLADMMDVCRKQHVLRRPSCRLAAAAFYDGVHFTVFGREAFFGD